MGRSDITVGTLIVVGTRVDVVLVVAVMLRVGAMMVAAANTFIGYRFGTHV